MGELVELIVDRYDGSLKAEHGTGVNMAHYVEREWGPKATELMWRVKRLADPDGVLGPGIVLTTDEGAHLRNLKSAPRIEDVANQCIECGFCEPVCPSRDLTTTPRQRIVLRREMARQPEGSPVLAALLERVRLRRHRDLRRRRALQPAVPGRHRHRQARQGAARPASQRRRGTGRAGGGAALGHRRTLGPRRAARRQDARRRSGGRAHGDRADRRLARAPPGLGGVAARPGARPAVDGARGRRRRVLPRLREPHLRQPPRLRRTPVAAGGSAHGLRAGRAPAVDPAGRRRPLLRHAVELEGLRGRPRRDGARDRRRRARVDRGRAPAARRRRELLHARAARGGPRAARRRAARGVRPGQDRRLDLVGPRRAAWRAADRPRSSTASRCTRRAQPATSGSPRS